MSEKAAIVLAAGKSTRMDSDLPKVLHEVCGRPMLSYVLDACSLAGVDRSFVVVGQDKDKVIERFEAQRGIEWIEQKKQKGTGHAVRCCRKETEGWEGSVLVVAGDMPLVRRETLANLIEAREQSGDALTLATAVLDDPRGYGRVVRDAQGELEAIVEDAECTPEQRKIREVNPSFYCFEAKQLFEALEQVRPSGSNGEYFLTDAVRILRDGGHGVSASVTAAPEDAMGVNSRLDLAVVGRLMQDRIQVGLMNEGVTIVDPDNTWIEADVSIGRDTILYPFTIIQAGAILGERCRVGPFARVGPDEVVEDGAVVEPVAWKGAAV